MAWRQQESFQATAVLGGLVSTSQVRFRMPQAQVRVGSYSFDNTNYVGSGVFFGSRYDSDRLPLDNDYAVLRRFLWLATDVAYKGALEAIARKRAALKNVAMAEDLPGFWEGRVRTRCAGDRARGIPVREMDGQSAIAVQPFPGLSGVALLAGTVGGRAGKALPGHQRGLGDQGSGKSHHGARQCRGPGARWQLLVRDVNVSHAIEFERLASDQELSAQIRTLADTVSRPPPRPGARATADRCCSRASPRARSLPKCWDATWC